MTHKPIVFPDGWGNDLLSKFQSQAFENELSTFAQAPKWQSLLCDVACVLDKCSSYAMDYQRDTFDSSASMFLMAYSQYLASVRSVAAGHNLAAYPTGRASVESALYAWYLSSNAEAGQRWHNKPTDKTKLKNWSDEFKFSSLAKKLGEEIQSLEKWATYLHQTAIDLGAHPNKDALYSNMQHELREDGSGVLKITYLHHWNLLSISTTKFTIETGVFTICLFALAFPDAEQKLLLTENTSRLKNNLRDLGAGAI